MATNEDNVGAQYRTCIHNTVCGEVLLEQRAEDTWYISPTSGVCGVGGGNDASCSALGFFVHKQVLTLSYNIISIYTSAYPLIIGNHSDRKLTKWVEPLMHVVSIAYFVAVAFTGIFASRASIRVLCGPRKRVYWCLSWASDRNNAVFPPFQNTALYCKVHKTNKRSTRFESGNQDPTQQLRRRDLPFKQLYTYLLLTSLRSPI